jgi:hypothetical protein
LYITAMDMNEPTQSRVSAGKTFLSKVLPDLKAIDIKAEIDMEVTAIEIQVVDDAPLDTD